MKKISLTGKLRKRAAENLSGRELKIFDDLLGKKSKKLSKADKINMVLVAAKASGLTYYSVPDGVWGPEARWIYENYKDLTEGLGDNFVEEDLQLFLMGLSGINPNLNVQGQIGTDGEDAMEVFFDKFSPKKVPEPSA